MNKKVLLTALFAVTIMFGVSAQKISGNLSPLKGQTKLNLVIDFSETKVSEKVSFISDKPIDVKPEEKYVADKINDKSDEEKERFLAEWNVKLRDEAYSFLIKDMNSALNKKGKEITVGNSPNAEYTIMVKVTLIEAGSFVGIKERSRVSADVSFVKTGETKEFASTTYNRIFNYVSDCVPHHVIRIAMSFGTLGSNICKTISKNVK